ncbi:MAG: hypothetical protein J6X58_00945 [Bacteroidales bacterium]|nr:hypothetical protein [Bacteroidales bacterium]
MNRIRFILTAKTQYNIQSPFLYELYSCVITPKLDRGTREKYNIVNGDSFEELLFKISNHYNARRVNSTLWNAEYVAVVEDGSLIGAVKSPHKNKETEKEWNKIVTKKEVTLSVDCYKYGLFFTSNKLSKQHILLKD